ncbi:MAG TPA: glycosyltransferase family 39 protein [Thermomicrobiales bacterium]|jgi:hypothetical protein
MATVETKRRRQGGTGQRPRKVRRQRDLRAILATVRPHEAEILLVLALFGLALLVRWPYLLRLPHFTDEIGEIRWTLQIYRGEVFPLTAQVKYFGPLHHYLLALCLWLFGPSITLPRALVCVIGALTVAMTYLIGREIGGWRLGLLGGLFLATLPQHIVVNSHVAWENSTTPFYATLCFYTVLRAVRALREGRVTAMIAAAQNGAGGTHSPPRLAAALRWLFLCSFCVGLMLQTHIGTIVLAPALAGTLLFALWRGRSWRLLRSPWLYLTPLAAIVAYSPVLIDNAMNGFAGFKRAQGRDYAFVADPTADTYLHNLRNLLFALARMISNPFRMPERSLHYLTSPYMLIVVGLALLGLTLLIRRGQPLPALATICTALAMPYFNHAYGVEGDRYLLTGRYIAFLLPPLMIALAAGALALAENGVRAMEREIASRRQRPAASQRAATTPLRVPRAALLLLPTLLILALVCYPLIPLRRYYTHESQQDPDNATFLETVRFVKSVSGPDTPVLIGPLFRKVDLKDGADALDILDILLTLDGVPHRIVNDPSTEIAQIAEPIDPANVAAQPIVIMMRDECFPIRDTAPLLRLSGRLRLRELYWSSPSYYGVYRYMRDLPPGGRCLPAAGATPGD